MSWNFHTSVAIYLVRLEKSTHGVMCTLFYYYFSRHLKRILKLLAHVPMVYCTYNDCELNYKNRITKTNALCVNVEKIIVNPSSSITFFNYHIIIFFVFSSISHRLSAICVVKSERNRNEPIKLLLCNTVYSCPARERDF